MNSLADVARIFLLSQNPGKDCFTEKDINSVLNEICMMPSYQNISSEEKEIARSELLATISIKLDEGILLENCTTRHQPWFLDRKRDLSMNYWKDYREYLLHQKHFASQIVNRMDKVLDEITDLLGNPISDAGYVRKGLVIGDVQSGKTANYTGLICKAVDAGYKVVVLLAGTTDKLREQTKKRLDEGFVGMPSIERQQYNGGQSSNQNQRIGVGRINLGHQPPIALTSSVSDFNADIARSVVVSLDVASPVLFVIKKNVSVLRQLNNWLTHFNQRGNGKIKQPLLLIDDEADNASINTRDNEDPTATNREIRRLLDAFSHSSYVGYTATPYANIFIDPETDVAMEHADLFPSDYIYCLDIPSNYIGARDIFGNENSVATKMLRTIDETIDNKNSIVNLLPLVHKKEGEFVDLPSDLKEAINTFLLANVIADLEKLPLTHRTMLINISRFKIRHQQISNAVWGYVQQIQRECQLFCKLEVSKALQNKSLSSLRKTLINIYPKYQSKWEEIQKNLHQSIASITIKTINYESDEKLNYDSFSEGLRVIVVGGLTLSRGLTLEGLVTSYFYRNSKMYDTLMQMGRWFEYRDGYAHLCRIWMSAQSQDWYHEISDATDELRADIKKYKDTGLTPIDFGLKVRSDINSLLVTARNKMRSTQRLERQISFSGEYIETPRLFSDDSVNKKNIDEVQNLIENLISKKYPIKKQAGKYGFIGVDKEYILKLLQNVAISPTNIHFDINSVIPFVAEHYRGSELHRWDIVFASGSSKLTQDFGYNIVYPISTRKYSLENEGRIIKMSGGSNRLGSTGDVKFGLTPEQIQQVEDQFKPKNPSAKGFFRGLKRNPLLVIYMIELGARADSQETEQDIALKHNQPYIGFGIGFPDLTDVQTRYARYVLNPVAIRQQEGINLDDDEGE